MVQGVKKKEDILSEDRQTEFPIFMAEAPNAQMLGKEDKHHYD